MSPGAGSTCAGSATSAPVGDAPAAPSRTLSCHEPDAPARRATIIEDDYDAEFRYDREPIGALQGLAPQRVVSIGTVSKSLAPAVRLGWIVCPPHLIDSVAAEKNNEDRGSPGLDQLALASLIESGRFDKHLRRMRTMNAAKRRTLIETLGAHAPHVALSGLAAGFHAVAHLPDGLGRRRSSPTRVSDRSGSTR